MVDAGCAVRLRRRLGGRAAARTTCQARVEALVARARRRGAGRLPRPPEPVARRGQLGVAVRAAPGRSTARCARWVPAPATRPPRCWSPSFDTARRARPASTSTACWTRPRTWCGRSSPGCRSMDRASIVQGYAGVYSSLPAARRARGRALRRPGPRDPARGRRGRLVGGQEDMIIDVAIRLAQGARRRGRLTDHRRPAPDRARARTRHALTQPRPFQDSRDPSGDPRPFQRSRMTLAVARAR